MPLTITSGAAGGAAVLYGDAVGRSQGSFPIRCRVALSSRRTLHVAAAAKKLPSRTGRFDSKRRRSAITTREEEEEEDQEQKMVQIDDGNDGVTVNAESFQSSGAADAASLPMPELPGMEPDFWEGSKWDALGFFVQYQWAFGIVFALIACGIAVATYNEGATDFKQTPVYKESIQSRELLEEPEGSNSDVFESNPTEVAPSLE